jgi:hypothetical protein
MDLFLAVDHDARAELAGWDLSELVTGDLE